MAWDTPVFVLTTGIEPFEIPVFLRRHPVFPVPERLPHAAVAVREATLPLTAAERRHLLDAFRDAGMTADELFRHPTTAGDVARRFQTLAGRPLPASRVLHELYRLRKAGKLPRLSARAG